MAEAVGIRGIRVEQLGDVEAAIADALTHSGPVLVDAVVNRTELSIPPKMTANMAKGFTLYMLKAILNGRGSEIVELTKTNLLR
jgi:pyruvate dehydrogenase (quinone)